MPSLVTPSCFPAVVTFTSRSQMGFLLLLEVDLEQQLLNTQPVMGGYMFQNTAECAGFDRGVIRDDLVILAVQLSCNSKMGTLLPVNQLAQNSECFYELWSIHIPGGSHRARTSSRTKCRRIIRGASWVSSK